MSTRAPWPARWPIYGRPTVSRRALTAITVGAGAFGTLDSQTTDASGFSISVGEGFGQSFSVPAGGWVLRSATFQLSDGGTSPDGTVVVKLYRNTGTLASPVVGTLLATSESFDPTVLTVTHEDVVFVFSDSIYLAAGEYFIAVERVGDTAGALNIRKHAVGTHGGIPLFESPPDTWAPQGGTHDLAFVLSGYSTVPAFTEGDFLRKVSNTVYGINETDPEDLFAIAAESHDDILEDGFVMVYELNAEHWIGMMGTRDPVAGDVGTAYGIVRSASGHWVVDLTDTTNTRVSVKAVDLAQKYYLVAVLSSHIQP